MQFITQLQTRLSVTAAPDLQKQFLTAAKPLVAKKIADGVKAGVPKDWMQSYLKEVLDELTYQVSTSGNARSRGSTGSLSVKEALADINAITVKEMQQDYAAYAKTKSVNEVKKEGVLIAKSQAKKNALIKKLGLTGAEFHALSLMLKEQSN